MLYLRDGLLLTDLHDDRLAPGLLPPSRMPHVLGLLGLPAPLTSDDSRCNQRSAAAGLCDLASGPTRRCPGTRVSRARSPGHGTSLLQAPRSMPRLTPRAVPPLPPAAATAVRRL